LDGGVPYFKDMAQRPELRRTNRVFAEAESGDGGPGAAPMREDGLGEEGAVSPNRSRQRQLALISGGREECAN